MKLLLNCLLLMVAAILAVDAIGPIKLPLIKRRSAAKQAANKSDPTHQSDFSLLFNNDYFAVGISLGTPPQPFEPALDMVDRRLFVLRYDYYSAPLTHGQSTYDPRDSTTFKAYGYSKQYYKDFYLYNNFNFSDVFTVNDDLTYSPQIFDAADQTIKYPLVRFEFPADGILGFGIPAKNSNETSSPSLNLLKQLPNPLYTVYIQNHVAPSVGTVGGQLTLGDYDTVKCATERFKPVSLYKGASWLYNWVIIVSHIKIRKYERNTDIKAYVNVGQPTVSFPTAILNGLLKQLSYTFQNGLYITACDQTTAPSIQLTISEGEFIVASRNYIVDMDLGNKQCVLAVEEGTGDNANLIGLGVPFLEGYCTSINVVDHTINFASVLVNPE